MEELAGIIILGIFAQWFAWRVKIPAILPLIVIGLLVGPISALFTADGEKLISPIYHLVGEDGEGRGLFPGQSLFYFVSLAIGVILFEGGLTLQFREVRETQRSILRLISIGSLVTFVGAGLAAHFIMGLGWSISFLFAALIIVTGPTVIAPILQNIPLNRNVSTVLKWEGILIDPLGALVAVLVFEFIRSTDHGIGFTGEALRTFVQIIIYGGTLGFLMGYALFHIIKRELVPHYLLNVFILAYVLFIFVVSDQLAHESGLLAVVVMGLVLANKDVPRIKEILSFKESLSVLLISILFILLAANMNMDELRLLTEDWRPLALFGFVILVLRPLSVFLSTARGNLSVNEKVFISWVGPRGIVAAGIASLFGLNLVADGVPGAEYITPLVFMIVLGTVLINATTARLVARLLGVIQDTSSGVLILGANDFAVTIGKYLKEQGREVFMVDSNGSNIRRAQDQGLRGIVANIYNSDLSDEYDLLDVGYMLALTGSNDVNAYAIRRYEDIFGERGAFRLITAEEMKSRGATEDSAHIFSHADDFINLSEAHREAAKIHEHELYSQRELLDLLVIAREEKYSIPLFIKSPDGQLNPIPYDVESIDVDSGNYSLVYLGVELPETASQPQVEEGKKAL
ncbi:sodium/proton antiporter (CPA1 family) [Neolewinella xylanilytica]|uniref:Sodium/proton antiporter (CPA1 family) n=1 Tax=Neolewinella xylanilytica TaxID=1514080 RepID=A0A2S6I0Z9_9BACT|nr:sodium:proton antiporter [Neolewinella xylanilytica]PPK84647.1 sodium/proton antiporter (CPA1 family) [Neolewinella xylanilytica]